jgi:hypothetical protein
LLAVGFLLVTGQRAVAAGASVPELWFAPNDDLPRGPHRDTIPGPDFQHHNTSNGRTGRKAARRYILSQKEEGLRRRHANIGAGLV